MKDPHNIIGKEIPAADGGNYGYRVLAYLPETSDYLVRAIRWQDKNVHGLSLPAGEYLDPFMRKIDDFKITYRYVPGEAREPISTEFDIQTCPMLK